MTIQIVNLNLKTGIVTIPFEEFLEHLQFLRRPFAVASVAGISESVCLWHRVLYEVVFDISK